MNILYSVCPNGFGHIKRALAISEALAAVDPTTRITLHISDKSARFFFENVSQLLLQVSNVITFPDDQGLSLRNMTQVDFQVNFFTWLDQLHKLTLSESFDLVLSDNLASPAAFSDKTILTGCFLWHDILEVTESTQVVLEFEKQQLEQHNPIMIHVQHLGMPYVLDATNAKSVPWITSKYPSSPPLSAVPRILVTAGKSGDSFDLFKRVAKLLSAESKYEVYVNHDMKIAMEEVTVREFDFQKPSFAGLSLIIGRPGIGILTDAIQYRIPILTHHSFSNKELRFNAQQIERLNIGKQIDLLAESFLFSTINELALPGPTRQSVLTSLAKQPDGGAEKAAQLILEHT